VHRNYSIALLVAALCLLGAIGVRALPEPEPSAEPHTVILLVDGQTREVETTAAAATVKGLLAEVGVSLGRLDRTDPSPATALADGMTVTVTRVSRRQEVEEETLPARTVLLADPERPGGFTKVLQHGQDGRVRRVVDIWAKDGQVTQRTVLQEDTLEPARDTVVLRGSRGLPSRGGDWRHPLTMEATGYDPGPRSCGKYASGYTATGAKARKGVAAVDDRVIPMGTRLYIPGYGFAAAADRGRAIKGMRIDLCFNTYREALRWGRQKVKVYLLD